MRIVMLSMRPTVQGPIPKHTPILVDAIRRLGHEVTLLPWGRGREHESRLEKLVARPMDIARARRIVQGGGVDVLVVKTAHDWRTLVRDIALVAMVRRACPQVVVQFHGSQADRLAQPGNRLFKLASAYLLRLSSGALVLSSDERRHWQALCPTRAVRIVDNPMVPLPDPGPGEPSWRRRLPAAQPVVLFVARLIAEKGVFDLLEAFTRLRGRAHLLVVGDGPERGRAQARAASLGIGDDVTFTGYLSGGELTSAYQAAAVLALPTTFDEGFPTVIAEAMQVGLPIVTTRIRGMADRLREGGSTLFVPARDPEALAEALERLLADPALRAAMGAASRDELRALAPDAVGRRYVEALAEVMQSAKAGGVGCDRSGW